MSKLILAGQTAQPDTPSSGQIACFSWNALGGRLGVRGGDGKVCTLGLQNFNTGDNTGFAADQYLVGSSIVVTAGQWRAGTLYTCRFDMAKTGAGTAGMTVNVRLGTAGSTADTSRCLFTFGSGSAAIDTGIYILEALFRSVGGGTSAVIQGYIKCDHALAATGLTSTGAAGTAILLTTGGGFDSTTPTTIGISINGGGSFVGTNKFVNATLQFI